MKINCFIFEILVFCAVFLFLALPPCFSFLGNVSEVFVNWDFPFQAAIYFGISIIVALLFNFFKKNDEKEIESKQKTPLYFSLKYIFPFIFCLCLLFVSSMIFLFISCLLPETNQGINLYMPDSFIKWVFCILDFFLAAFFEEIIYRYYLTDGFVHLFRHPNKVLIIFAEFFTLVVFSFGHFYMGWLSVLNAAVGHIILRGTYKYSKSILPGFIAHFTYNMISLILL